MPRAQIGLAWMLPKSEVMASIAGASAPAPLPDAQAQPDSTDPGRDRRLKAPSPYSLCAIIGLWLRCFQGFIRGNSIGRPFNRKQWDGRPPP